MARIYKLSTKIPVKINDAIFQLSPLSIAQKDEITCMLAEVQSEGLKAAPKMLAATRLALKYAIKGLDGVFEDDAELVPFVLTFDSEGNLDNDSLEALSNFEYSGKLNEVIMSLISGFSQKNKIEDVEINYKGDIKKQKK